MTSAAQDPSPAADGYPGQQLGLPAEGRGSLARWGSRITALVLDWVICMVVAMSLFGSAVMTGSGWQNWMILSVFFVESTVLTTLVGGSAGQLILRIAVVRVDRTPLGLGPAALRAALLCLVIPALVVGVDRRGLHDMAAGTVVVNRR